LISLVLEVAMGDSIFKNYSKTNQKAFDPFSEQNSKFWKKTRIIILVKIKNNKGRKLSKK
jgi:hypothetical protein